MDEKTKAGEKGGRSGKAVALLKDFVEKKVMLIMFDGRTVVGTLRGFDQTCNLVLEKAMERVFAARAPPKEIALGLFLVRGENVACVGLVDDEKDAASNWQNVKVRGDSRVAPE